MIDWLDWLARDARVIELRHHHGGRWRSGLFDDLAALRAAVRSRQHQGNLYTTVNRPFDSVRVNNAMDAPALTDGDVEIHTRLLFDFDPLRPKGLASSRAEQQQAIKVGQVLMSRLLGLGWPAPAVGRSGNGAHLVYRSRLPAGAETAGMLAAIYRGLHIEFSTEAVEFDRTVRNPARIWRLYGTTNRKGEPTSERPHRQAQIVIPAQWRAVSPRAVEALANHYARTETVASPMLLPRTTIAGRGDYRTLDVVGWFSSRGMYRRHLGHGKHAVVCPWSHEHSNDTWVGDTSTVVWEATENWPSFHCSHTHCEGRSIREVMALWGNADAYCGRLWERAP